MHSYKITIHFVGGTSVEVFLRDVDCSKKSVLESFSRVPWVCSEDEDMAVNSNNIAYIVIDEIVKENDNG